MEVPTNQPIVLLREEEGQRYLPIFIGPPEATAIVYALQGMETPRPMTHDLFRTVLDDVSMAATGDDHRAPRRHVLRRDRAGREDDSVEDLGPPVRRDRLAVRYEEPGADGFADRGGAVRRSPACCSTNDEEGGTDGACSGSSSTRFSARRLRGVAPAVARRGPERRIHADLGVPRRLERWRGLASPGR